MHTCHRGKEVQEAERERDREGERKREQITLGNLNLLRELVSSGGIFHLMIPLITYLHTLFLYLFLPLKLPGARSYLSVYLPVGGCSGEGKGCEAVTMPTGGVTFLGSES